ncbi:GNAT family N-acetyltransferase [Chiayiivirga flava]|uniref:Putative N-acetyltransferase YhbS n=1 Tax=Chiayiivirga flava TaxID=659595 RepID=A0A7W8FZQ5_9GAMM|nr:GNAT family N-acetyltransferase [Chiayiivirga flava]MBB5208717.1 putative N-acetyltransferase YhbS [Chiayiivirga flava]
MRLAYLSEHPALAPAVAAAQSAAFAHQLPDWSQAQALAELRTHTGTRTIPTTLLALDGERWLGTVSLLENDHDRIRDYSPWLATLVVRDDMRGRGIGTALVRRCVEDARALGIVTLYLYCVLSLVDYYARLGWTVVARVHVVAVASGDDVFVMAFDCSAQRHGIDPA